MTAVCQGGTSGPKPVNYTITSVDAAGTGLLIDIFGPLWLKVLIPFLVIPPIVLSTFCSSDPPAEPTFTTAESDAVTNLQVWTADFKSALSKFSDHVLRLFWYQSCECTSGALLPLPPAPVQPAGAIVIAAGPTACGYTGPAGMVASEIFVCLTSQADGFCSADVATPLPAGATSITWTQTVTSNGAHPSPGDFYLEFFDSSGAALLNDNAIAVPVDTTTSRTFAIPTGAVSYALQAQGGGVNSSILRSTATVTCGNTALATAGCCPGDPVNAILLARVLDMVTLIQRQAVPFSYIAGTAHAGLINQGALSVQGLIGLKIALTTLPGSYGRQLAEPTYLFDVGWWSVGTADGFIADRRVQSSAQIWLPEGMSAMTLVGYSLSPGVVATITELEREA